MESDTSSRKMNQAKRRQLAIDMRMKGDTFAEIGVALGIDRAAAWRIVRRQLDSVNKANTENVESMRELELQRLDKLQQAVWHQAVELGDIPSLRAVLKIMERRAKLAGLDIQMQKGVAASQQVNPYDGITETEAAKLWSEILAEAAEAERKRTIN